MPAATDTAILDQLAAQAGSLYSLPAVALEILQLTSSPKVDVRELKDRIEYDPALTTKILRTVNSALFGLSGQVSDLNQALSLLGIKSLKMLVLGFSLPKQLFEEVDKEVLTLYWRQTITRAVVCRELCRAMRSKFGDETFIAALLKDLGILVLIQELGKPYAQLFLKASKDKYDLSALEYRSLGFDHTQLTGRLLRNWSLPEALIQTIDTSPHRQMPISPDVVQQRAILAVAEKIVMVLVNNQSDELAEALRLAKETLRLGEESFFDAISHIEDLVLQMSDILSLQLPQGLGYDDLLSEARESMRVVSSSVELKVRKKDISPEDYTLLETELQNVAQMLMETMAKRDSKRSSTKAEPKSVARAESGASKKSETFQKPQTLQKSESFQKTQEQAVVTSLQNSPGSDLNNLVNAGVDRGGVDSGSSGDLLLDRVKKAVTLCRQKRLPLSLLVGDVMVWSDGLASSSTNSPKRRPASSPLLEIARRERQPATSPLLENARRDLEQACSTLDHPFQLSCSYGKHGVAVVLLDCERNHAIELAEDLIRSMPKEYNLLSSHKSDDKKPGLRLGIGLASASAISPNFLPEGLIDGAKRCLHVALTTAGRPVKSIEVF